MISFDINMSVLDELDESIQASCTKAECALAVVVAKDTNPFVPALTGTMSNSTQVDRNVIIYKGPQARYLYNGKLMVDPVTGSAWARKGSVKKTTDKNLQYNKSMHPMAQSHWFEASKALNLEKWTRIAGGKTIGGIK